MPYEDLTGTIVRKICTACSREFSGAGNTCPHDGHQLMALPQDQWEGRKLADKYQIKHRLGTGGMGVVYLAWHELMERWVAIKMLKSSFIEDQPSVARFQREAQAASRLKHPNVISLYDFGITDNGQPYMVMDYLVSTHKDPKKHPARSLAQEIKSLKNISVERVIHIIAQACDALDHAHRQGVIHRDIKPANIMIVPTDEDPDCVKVVDFGVAKLLPINQVDDAEVQGITQVGEVCGSPVYMSPEQCMGQSLDPRADIYSMGVVAYEALTGKLPLLGKNMVDTMSKHLREKPPSFKEAAPELYIHDRVEQVVQRALSKDPHQRQQKMSELAQDLRFAIPRAGQTPNLKTHELLPMPETEQEKPKWIFAVVGASALAAAIGLFMFLTPKPETSPAPPSVALPSTPPAVTTATTKPEPKTAQPTAATTSTPMLSPNLTEFRPEKRPAAAPVTSTVPRHSRVEIQSSSQSRPSRDPAAVKKRFDSLLELKTQ